MSARNRKHEKSSGVSSGKTSENVGGSTHSRKGPFSGRFNPKLQKRPDQTANNSFIPHQTWARIVMVLSIITVIYFSNYSQNKTIMAKQADIISSKRFQSFLCPPSYKKEIEELASGCVPTKCGRVVLDNIVTSDEANSLLSLAKRGFVRGGSSGGASILDLHSGALSKDESFINIYQSFSDLFSPQDFTVYRNVKEKVKNAIADHFGLSTEDLHLTYPTFFSRLDTRPAKTLHDEYWHVHVDKETYPSFHYTSLLYLTDYGIDFEGGAFVFVDNHDKLNRTIEPRMGRVSFFTSGIENKHHVEPVTSGSRYALTMGFTCDPQQKIPEPGTEGHQLFTPENDETNEP